MSLCARPAPKPQIRRHTSLSELGPARGQRQRGVHSPHGSGIQGMPVFILLNHADRRQLSFFFSFTTAYFACQLQGLGLKLALLCCQPLFLRNLRRQGLASWLRALAKPRGQEWMLITAHAGIGPAETNGARTGNRERKRKTRYLYWSSLQAHLTRVSSPRSETHAWLTKVNLPQCQKGTVWQGCWARGCVPSP